MIAVVFSIFTAYGFVYGDAKTLMKGAVVTLLGIIIYFLAISDVFIFSETSRLNAGIASAGGRLGLWEQGLMLFINSDLLTFLTGYGFMLPQHSFYTGSLVTNSLHNGYLQVLVGTGILGFCAYFMIWGSLLYGNSLALKSYRFCFYALLLFLGVFNFTELGSLVLVNSMSLTFIVLMGLSYRNYN